MSLLRYKYNESLVLNPSETYHLSVWLSNSDAQFLVCSAKAECPLLVSHVLYDGTTKSEEVLLPLIEQCVLDLKLQHVKYESVSLAIHTEDFVLVPEQFANGEEQHLLDFANGVKLERQILKQNTGTGQTVIYGINAQLVQGIERLFRNVKFSHSGASAISFQPRQVVEGLFMLVIVHESSIELVVKDGQKLLFYNLFETHSVQDVLYYTLYVAEQLNLQAAVHPFYIAANLSSEAEQLQLLKKYIQNLHLVNERFNEGTMPPFSALPEHYFYTLKRIHSCVS